MAVAYTFTPDDRGFERVGSRKSRLGTLTMTGTNTALGDAVTAAVFQLTSLQAIEFQDTVTTSGYSPRFDPATLKIVLFEGGGAVDSPGGEADAGQTVTGTIRVRALGH